MPDKLFDFIFAIHDGDGKRLMILGRTSLCSIEGVGENIDVLLATVLDDLVGTELEVSFV